MKGYSAHPELSAKSTHLSFSSIYLGHDVGAERRLASAAGFTSALDAWRLDLGLSIDDVTFTGAPLAHVGGIYTVVLRPLSLRGRSVVLPRWDSEIAIDLIEQERATIAPGTTVFLRDLVERYERNNSPGHHLEIFSSSGAPTPPNLIRRADAQGIYAFRSYGMTECLGTIAHPCFRHGAALDVARFAKD